MGTRASPTRRGGGGPTIRGADQPPPYGSRAVPVKPALHLAEPGRGSPIIDGPATWLARESPGTLPGQLRAKNSFPESSDPPRSDPEKNQRNNPPTSERYMSDVSLRDPTDKRSHWFPTHKWLLLPRPGGGPNVRQSRDAGNLPPDVGPSSPRAGLSRASDDDETGPSRRSTPGVRRMRGGTRHGRSSGRKGPAPTSTTYGGCHGDEQLEPTQAETGGGRWSKVVEPNARGARVKATNPGFDSHPKHEEGH